MFAITRKESPSATCIAPQAQVVKIVTSSETDLKKLLYDAASKKGALVKNNNGTPYFIQDEKLNLLTEHKTVVVTPLIVGTWWNTPEELKTDTVAEWGILELPVDLVHVACEEAKTDADCIAEIKKIYSEVKSYEEFQTKPELLIDINENVHELTVAGLTQLNEFAKSTGSGVGMNNLAGYTYQLLRNVDLAIPFYLAATIAGDFIAMHNLMTMAINDPDISLKAYWAQRIEMTNAAYFDKNVNHVKDYTLAFAFGETYAIAYYAKLGLTLPLVVLPETKLVSDNVKLLDNELLLCVKNNYAEVKSYSDFHTKPHILRAVNHSIKQLSPAGLAELLHWASEKSIVEPAGLNLGLLNLSGYVEQLLGKDTALRRYVIAASMGDIVAMVNLQLFHRLEKNANLQAYWIQRVEKANPDYFTTIYRTNPFTTTFEVNKTYATAYYASLGMMPL